jgi:predicted nucleic acid-binding Zn ribbon protein
MDSHGKNSNRKSKLQDASDVLQSLLKNGKSPLAQSFTRWKLWSNWEDVVGDSMAKHSTPVHYSKGCLVIWVDGSARMQEMTFLVRPLRDKINQFVGRQWVRSIRFTTDRHHVPDKNSVDRKFHDLLK